MAEKGWIREHAVKTIVGTLITLAIGGTITFLSPHVRGWLVAGLRAIGTAFHWLGQPVVVTRWHFWVLALISAAVVIIVVVLLVADFFARPPSELPDHVAYHEDRFFGLTWRWRWFPDGKLDAQSLTAYCPVCDRMIPVEFEGYGPTRFRCQPCGGEIVMEGNTAHSLNRVIREIDLKLRKGTWKETIGSE